MLRSEGLLETAATGRRVDRPLAAEPDGRAAARHFPARAKRVIWVFVNGGPSQVDTWDYKPALAKWDGKSIKEFDPTSRTRPASSRTRSAA